MVAPPVDEGELTRRLAALAEALPPTSGAGRLDAVRRRARSVRRRQAAGAATAGGVLAAVALLSPLPGLSTAPREQLVPATAAPAATAARPTPPPHGVVATFDFPDQDAVAELVLPAGPVRAGVPARYLVRVRTERGRVGGVDLVFGDGEVAYLDGAPTCTPDAGSTVVELWSEHAFAAPGRYTVRARPQVLTGCREGRGLRTPGGTASEAVVEVG